VVLSAYGDKEQALSIKAIVGGPDEDRASHTWKIDAEPSKLGMEPIKTSSQSGSPEAHADAENALSRVYNAVKNTRALCRGPK